MRTHAVRVAVLTVLALFAVSGLAAQSTQPVTNDDIVKMAQSKLSTNIILTAIDSAKAVRFDVSPAGLIALKTAGVPDAVIEAMQARARLARDADAPAAPPTPTSTAPPPATPTPPTPTPATPPPTTPPPPTPTPTTPAPPTPPATMAPLTVAPRPPAIAEPPEKSESLATSRDAAAILSSFKTLLVDASKAKFFGNEQMKAALGRDKGFPALKIAIVDDPSVADVVLEVGYTFAWDYPFSIKHQNSSVVLVSGKGSGPFSGPAGAKSVAGELVKLLRPYRVATRPAPTK